MSYAPLGGDECWRVVAQEVADDSTSFEAGAEDPSPRSATTTPCGPESKLVSQMPRECAFCSQPANSKEHVWPDWLRRTEDIRAALPHVLAEQRGAGAPEVVRQYEDQPYKMKTGYVCKTCNHGWMSDLEQDVEQIMGGMLAGRGRELGSGSQAALAAWAFKMAVVFDRVWDADAWVVPSEHAHALREHGEPPYGTRLWMASYDTTSVGISRMFACSTALEGQDYDSDSRNVYVRTFTVGPTLFQIYGTTNPGLTELDTKWPLHHEVHQLWPYAGTFTWRPRPAMTDEIVAAFADRIFVGLSTISAQVDP